MWAVENGHWQWIWLMKLYGCYRKDQPIFWSCGKNRLRVNRPDGDSARPRVTTIADPKKDIFLTWGTPYLLWTGETVSGSVAVYCADRIKAVWTGTAPRSQTCRELTWDSCFFSSFFLKFHQCSSVVFYALGLQRSILCCKKKQPV